MNSNPGLAQIPPGFSQGSGLIPASSLSDGGEIRLALERALHQITLHRGGAYASLASPRDAGPGSVWEFPQFEHGAGI
jgi:hypothetical protein